MITLGIGSLGASRRRSYSDIDSKRDSDSILHGTFTSLPFPHSDTHNLSDVSAQFKRLAHHWSLLTSLGTTCARTGHVRTPRPQYRQSPSNSVRRAPVAHASNLKHPLPRLGSSLLTPRLGSSLPHLGSAVQLPRPLHPTPAAMLVKSHKRSHTPRHHLCDARDEDVTNRPRCETSKRATAAGPGRSHTAPDLLQA